MTLRYEKRDMRIESERRDNEYIVQTTYLQDKHELFLSLEWLGLQKEISRNEMLNIRLNINY